MGDEVVVVDCIEHKYPDGTEVKVCGLKMLVRKSERVVVLGPNGSGKTTLLLHIMGILKPSRGFVRVMGIDTCENIQKIRQKMGVVFQNPEEQIIAPTVEEEVALSLASSNLPPEEIKKHIRWAIKMVGLEGMERKVPHYLSEGEKKKLAIASAIVLKPEILILDEPTMGLDSRSKYMFIRLIMDVTQSLGSTLIMTTHDVDIVPFVADKVYVINKGEIMKYGTSYEILQDAELLRAAGLTMPIITKLAFELQKEGFGIEKLPVTLDEAKDIFMKHIVNKR